MHAEVPVQRRPTPSVSSEHLFVQINQIVQCVKFSSGSSRPTRFISFVRLTSLAALLHRDPERLNCVSHPNYAIT